MTFDSFLGDAGELAYFFVAQAFGHQAKDFYFQFGQAGTVDKIPDVCPIRSNLWDRLYALTPNGRR